METWKDIKEFEGYYQISNKGRLKSFKLSKKGIVLKQTNKKKGYFSVVLNANKKTKYTRIHRLVAEYFLSNPNNKPQVHHKDHNKQNNNVENLEWVTSRENTMYNLELSTKCIDGMIYYNKYVKPKKIYQFSKDGKLLDIFNNSKEASVKTKVCARNILQVASKTPFDKNGNYRKQAGGYIWKYESEVIL